MSVPRKSRHERRYQHGRRLADTPRNDGFFWNLTPDADAPAEPEPTGPRKRTQIGPRSNLNDGWDDDGPPDEVYDALAAEDAEAETNGTRNPLLVGRDSATGLTNGPTSSSRTQHLRY